MKHRNCSNLSLVILLHWFLVGSAFSPIRAPTLSKRWQTILAVESDPGLPDTVDKPDIAQNETYIQGLINNLTLALDRWIITGSPVKVRFNLHFLVFPVPHRDFHLNSFWGFFAPDCPRDRKRKCKTFSTKSNVSPSRKR